LGIPRPEHEVGSEFAEGASLTILDGVVKRVKGSTSAWKFVLPKVYLLSDKFMSGLNKLQWCGHLFSPQSRKGRKERQNHLVFPCRRVGTSGNFRHCLKMAEPNLLSSFAIFRVYQFTMHDYQLTILPSP
jgi:hypothetical protein